MKAIFAIFILFLTISPILGQKGEPHGKELPTSIPVKPGTEVREARTKLDAGSVIGRSYINPTLSFQVTFPDSWLIPGPDFEDYMKSAGFDLHTINTEALGPVAKARFAKNVTVLLTAYRSMPGTPDNTFFIIAAEDISAVPAIKDAVDYIDVVRAGLLKAKLPAGFKVGETDAEKLGAMQFAFLDASSGTQKRRLYATVRKGYAVLFTVSYVKDEDLVVARKVLETGDFFLPTEAAPQ
ncbi:MAG: hypothetical protein UZ17_ACD001002022 [Acidobacteria bacterium OLB17]|nr:MAG: hypothetical protein UZ17_ACD001002022 [Acidobacteria bacterium OLB17]MCZ2389946.1 hypothetical protein [Acidobacteriota bacterium]